SPVESTWGRKTAKSSPVESTWGRKTQNPSPVESTRGLPRPPRPPRLPQPHQPPHLQTLQKRKLSNTTYFLATNFGDFGFFVVIISEGGLP
ncbi:hypothetical protein, partial [Lactobacillus equicursoris]|uniref:hypothetical protein n=1 Tax=Lactobacillus equicursoris TaxID=420645 RepID=UPI001EE1D8AC